MKITQTQLMVGTGCGTDIAEEWLDSMQTAADKFEINTPNRVAAWLANVGVESAGFRALFEDCDYSANGLANTWPNRYSVDQHAVVKIPNVLAVSLAHKPMAIANNVYANRMGNGDEESGDGWKNRGQGPIQITGAANIAACAAEIGKDIIVQPVLLRSPQYGSLSAAWFFSHTGCKSLADSGDIDGVVKRINGQLPCEANNGALRIARYHACLDAIKAG
jgi:putative chitinase